MKDGIYHVRFSSNMQNMGEGIAVFKGDSVNGGDSGYTYAGQKRGDDQGFTATLTIKRWNSGAQSVFGPINEFQLQFQGRANGADFVAEGNIVGQLQAKIAVKGKFLVPAS